MPLNGAWRPMPSGEVLGPWTSPLRPVGGETMTCAAPPVLATCHNPGACGDDAEEVDLFVA